MLVLPAAQAAAEVLVLRSSGADVGRLYPRGMRLADDRTVSLGRGESITLLTSQRSRRFEGPIRLTIGNLPPLRNSPYWISQRRAFMPRLATGRGPAGPREVDILAPFEPLWTVTFRDNRRFCYFAEELLLFPRGFRGGHFRREWEARTARVEIRRLPDGEVHDYGYVIEDGLTDDGGVLVGWPSEFPLEDGARFAVRTETRSGEELGTVEIEFAAIDTDPFEGLDTEEAPEAFWAAADNRIAALAREFDARGCTGQRDAALAQLGVSSVDEITIRAESRE